MTKEEFRNMVKGTKLEVGTHMREIQLKLFEAGIYWYSMREGMLRNLGHPYLFIDYHYPALGFGSGFNKTAFEERPMRLISAEDILNCEFD